MKKSHAHRIGFALSALLLVAGVAPVFGQGADDCNNAQAIAGDGFFFFDNTTATTDGATQCGLEQFKFEHVRCRC